MTDCKVRVSKWSDYGVDFGVPIDKREEFRDRRLSSQESLEECVDYWIRNVPGEKSWQALTDIIGKHEKNTAQVIRRTLRRGKWTCACTFHDQG